MYVLGDIFFHKNFQYSNGTFSDKLLVLLNTPTKDDPYLFVKVTSQQHGKPSIPGCIERFSVYFINAKIDFFIKDTWVELDELFPMVPDKINRNKDLDQKGTLSHETIKKIINCLFKSEGDNLPKMYAKLLRPPVVDGIHKLMEKFNK